MSQPLLPTWSVLRSSMRNFQIVLSTQKVLWPSLVLLASISWKLSTIHLIVIYQSTMVMIVLLRPFLRRNSKLAKISDRRTIGSCRQVLLEKLTQRWISPHLHTPKGGKEKRLVAITAKYSTNKKRPASTAIAEPSEFTFSSPDKKRGRIVVPLGSETSKSLLLDFSHFVSSCSPFTPGMFDK